MTIHRTPFDATVTASYRYEALIKQIEQLLPISKAVVVNVAHRVEYIDQFVLLADVGHESDQVHAFLHPAFGEFSGKRNVYLDARPYLVIQDRNDLSIQSVTVRHPEEFNWQLKRAALSARWLNEEYRLLRDLSKFPMFAYAESISQIAGNRYSLSVEEQLRLKVAAAFFYFCLFERSDFEMDETTLSKAALQIAQAIMVPADVVMKQLSGTEPYTTLASFCDSLETVTGNLRLRGFNQNVFLSMVGHIWGGVGSREVLAVGLEHPPTWMMICYGSVGMQGMKKTLMAKMMERVAKGDLAKMFCQSIDRCIDTPALSDVGLIKEL